MRNAGISHGNRFFYESHLVAPDRIPLESPKSGVRASKSKTVERQRNPSVNAEVDSGSRETVSSRQMPFNIPAEEVAAIKVLKAMPDASVDAFIAAVESANLTADTDAIAKSISERVPSIPPKQLESVLDALYQIYFVRELSGVSRSIFFDDFMDGLQSSAARANKNEIRKLRAKFEKLLNIEAFNLLSKAKRLQRDGERLYCDAKIISDIRPVFGSKATTRPSGAVVTHTLKLGYHEGGDHKEFHVVLDCVDLDLLDDVIGRAKAKDKTLRDLLTAARLPVLGV